MRNFQLPGRSTVHAFNGMAATSHPLATLAALDVLRNGGTAADAAVTAAALLGVIEPQSTGIGGDCFVLYAPAGAAPPVAYNGSGAVPRAAAPEWFQAQGIDGIGVVSPHSVSVPGAVDCWARLLADHGRKGLDAALQPAIRAAEDGYPVSPRVAWDWKRNFAKLQKGANTGRYLPGGAPPKTGQIMRLPELGQTLRAIARDGRDAFYTGAVADDIATTLRGLGGLMTVDDLAAHATEITAPLKTVYRGCEVWQVPPNGPGLTMLVMLNILGGFELAQYDPRGVERFHLEAEATRLAYIARESELGDPRFVALDIERLLSPAFADDARRKISLTRAATLQDAKPPYAPSTVYLTIVDRDRNCCSFINSVAYAFGSAIVSAKTGVLLQNRAAGFRIEPGHPNCIAPGKRPLHTIIPGMVSRGGRVLSPFGVMGGQYQPVGQIRVLTNVLDYGMDPQAALDDPRGLHYDGLYSLEQGVPAAVVEGLRALGHRTHRSAEPYGGGQMIWIDWENGGLVGASDPRKDGCALGY